MVDSSHLVDAMLLHNCNAGMSLAIETCCDACACCLLERAENLGCLRSFLSIDCFACEGSEPELLGLPCLRLALFTPFCFCFGCPPEHTEHRYPTMPPLPAIHMSCAQPQQAVHMWAACPALHTRPHPSTHIAGVGSSSVSEEHVDTDESEDSLDSLETTAACRLGGIMTN